MLPFSIRMQKNQAARGQKPREAGSEEHGQSLSVL